MTHAYSMKHSVKYSVTHLVAGFTIVVFSALILALLAASPAQPKFTPSALSTVLVSNNNGGHGSGVHTGGGFIVTAAHVVEDRKTMSITDSRGVVQTGYVLWHNKQYDLALIQVNDPSDLQVSELNCAAGPAIGDKVMAVGNPLGLKFIHTWGRVASSVGERGPWKSSFISDMTVAPGMSGGPVLDKAGRVVGIAVGVATAQMGFSASLLAVSYIVPSSAVCMLMARK